MTGLAGRRIPVLLVLTIALAAGACGSDEGPTREEFVADIEEICREHRKNIDRAAAEVISGGEAPSAREFMSLANETIIPETEMQFEMMGEVEPPEDLADEFDSYVEEGRQTVEEMKQNPTIITDPASFEDLNSQAEELGVSEACHVGPPAPE